MDRYDVSELLSKIPLKDVVRRLGIETERRGTETRALCPFHQDTQPSLVLYRADNSSPEHYHCFACGAHGNAIDLVKRIEGLEFLAAVSWLAQHFGLQSMRQKQPARGNSRVTSETALDFALRNFDENHNATRFKLWCEERGFSAEYLYGYGLRCITRSVLLDALQKKGLGDQVELIDGLEGLGLIRRLRNPSSTRQGKLALLDSFRDYFYDGRVIIPIRAANSGSADAKVIGFAGRSLHATPPEGNPKYLLTVGFDKSHHLFNANDAFRSVEKTLKDGQSAKIYLVEGFLDALRLQSLGVPAVALMGISLSNQQLNLLKGLAENVTGTGALAYVVFLDSDAAGFSGANRLIRRLLDLQGVDLRWVGLPWRTEPTLGKDPDTCLRTVSSAIEATAWLERFELPAEGVLLSAEMGGQDASELQAPRWSQLAATPRERALFRTALLLKRLYGHRLLDVTAMRLSDSQLPWALQLKAMLTGANGTKPPVQRSVYLDEALPRSALARRLAYHGARRGELPCDEDSWQTLNSNEYLFDETALNRLSAVFQQGSWHQAAPFDAVHLPRNISAEKKALDDPRRKVMPHPADLHAQQLFLNEILSERHDRLSAGGQAFSSCIPAVRWYASRQEVVVTGGYQALNEPDTEWDEPKTLSFGYQIDMDVLEGDKTPSDQGMFRPFGQCWRDFMASLAQQCHTIGPRVHVLRLDAKRYYDSIQKYVVREELLKPLSNALRIHKPEGFERVLGIDAASPDLDSGLERLMNGFVFGHEYHDPEVEAHTKHSQEVVGIPQGPVLSAYIGTISLFQVDDAARKFIRRTRVEEPEADGKRRPRAGYARYVDDVVIFADSEALLKELREVLQDVASARSIALVHKGERVRAGSPNQVMRQLNDGRGLAASVPAWDLPSLGDGETDWSLGDDLPKVDRQCALQMLRNPALMDRPEEITDRVKAAMTAPDLRASDLGLCARWLWWHIAAVRRPSDPEAAWPLFLTIWNDVCEGHDWAPAFAERGYDILFAVEGLDRLLEPNPWQANGQFLTEVDKSRACRLALAQLVQDKGFFPRLASATNRSHILRRTRLVERKAWRLTGHTPSGPVAAPQSKREVTAIEWLCLAGSILSVSSDDAPLAALEGRDVVEHTELALAQGVINHLMSVDAARAKANEAGFAIDFVVRSALPSERLALLSKFRGLLSSVSREGKRRLIPHLPVLNHQKTSFYEIDSEVDGSDRYLYRCRLVDDPSFESNRTSHFVWATLHAESSIATKETQTPFAPIETEASTVYWERSATPQPLRDLNLSDTHLSEPKTHLAAKLFLRLLAMHQLQVDDGEELAYVPFLPQLFLKGKGESISLHLVADSVPRNLLGVSAWYHDADERVRSENVPLAGADFWRVGWAVADVLGIAACMADEGGARDELLDDSEEFDSETHAKAALENYVLRQQLRKLQGSYLSGAQIDTARGASLELPGTVRRAIKMLQDFPAEQGLDAQVRHAILVEAESRAMAMRMKLRSGDDLRHVLHRVFPAALSRLPLWALTGINLQKTAPRTTLRPELSLALALYGAIFPSSSIAHDEECASPLQAALALTAVGIGLRGSVAAMWGYSANLGANRMDESLILPERWSGLEMERLDPQGDYRAMRKLLFEGNWTELSKASPWKWMLALIGLLNASFSQAFELASLESVYRSLSIWQTGSAQTDESDIVWEPWPFDALPKLTLQNCKDMMQALPTAVTELDQKRGMKVVRVQGRSFGRVRDSDEFTDTTGAGWQMSRPQYTSLYTNLVEEHRPKGSARVLKIWTETRRISNNDLLAVHTLDPKLGKWLPSATDVLSGMAESPEIHPQVVRRDRVPGMDEEIAGVDEAPVVPPSIPESTLSNLPQIPSVSDYEVEVTPIRNSNDADGFATGTEPPKAGLDARRSAAAADSAAAPLILPAYSANSNDTTAARGYSSLEGISSSQIIERLSEWQHDSWKNRLGGESSYDQDARISPHFRVAVFQHRIDDSYSHPIAEVGLSGLPVAKSLQATLRTHLNVDGQLSKWNKAAQRLCEFQWTGEQRGISWPEHRRRVLLSQALKVCRDLKVQLLVLPEVSVRPDTVAWLKDQLKNFPGLAVLAGTYRHFEGIGGGDHLKEMLSLLWKPDTTSEVPFGLESDSDVIEFKRGKKYRSVAAHELFRPHTQMLQPLYTEESLLEALSSIRNRAGKGEWSADQLSPLVHELVHGPHKLRYCMELICSELFMLTSPANRPPLEQELARMLQIFGGNPSEAKTLVNADVAALGELLTFAQRKRERRSVLLVPAFTGRSNDYWHAGQASVLASGTATVFCNAANRKLSVGGSCFIGIDSVSNSKFDHTGSIHLLTPYHGWSKGILQPDCKGALSPIDQALVVVDLDPVHVVSGKPRPQLLPEPMSLVAYLPIVEIIDKQENSKRLVDALGEELTAVGQNHLRDILSSEAFPETCGPLHERHVFAEALKKLLEDKESGKLNSEKGGAAIEVFKDFFGDPRAVRERIFAWLKDRHQQPAPRAGELRLEPAWLDFLVADITWRHIGEEHPKIRVPSWMEESPE